MLFTRLLKLLAFLLIASVSHSAGTNITGKIEKVHAGKDDWYGVRFILNIQSIDDADICNPAFIYTEPKPNNGHDSKVAIFLSAYMANKDVRMLVVEGRGGYCELVEGHIY